MKIIVLVNTDDQEKLNHIKRKIKDNEIIVVPDDPNLLKVFIISDSGGVVKLK